MHCEAPEDDIDIVWFWKMAEKTTDNYSIKIDVKGRNIKCFLRVILA